MLRIASLVLIAAICSTTNAFASGEQYETRPCPVCKGSGKERSGNMKDKNLYTCRRCKGTGTIKVLVKQDPVKPGKTMGIK